MATLPERILSVLGESALPVPTPDLVAITDCGRPHHREQVWVCLRKLRAGGLVRQSHRHTRRAVPGAHTVVFWTLTGG